MVERSISLGIDSPSEGGRWLCNTKCGAIESLTNGQGDLLAGWSELTNARSFKLRWIRTRAVERLYMRNVLLSYPVLLQQGSPIRKRKEVKTMNYNKPE